MSKLHRFFTRVKKLITRVNTQKTESINLIDKHFARLTDAVHKRRAQLLNKLEISASRQQSILNELHETNNRDVRIVTHLQTAAVNALTTHQCDTFDADSNRLCEKLDHIAKRQVTHSPPHHIPISPTHSSLTHHLTPSLPHHVTHSPPDHSLNRHLTRSPPQSLPASPTHSLTHPFTHPLTHSFTYSLTHSLTHSSGPGSRQDRQVDERIQLIGAPGDR